MKKTIHTLLSLAIPLLFAKVTLGYYRDSDKAKSPDGQTRQEGPVRGANCAPANYRKTMSFNDVSCQIETGGLLFLDRANGVGTYKVPKTGNVTAIYAGSLWMGGVDDANNLHLAAVRFRTTGNDFWPGPLDVNEGSGNYDPLNPVGDNVIRDHGSPEIDPLTCATYDNIFTIRKAEVIQFITWWECNIPNPFNPDHENCEDVEAPDNEVLSRINAWPGNGPQGDDPFLAPFFDRNGDGDYNSSLTLEGGDYPWFDDILGRNHVECGVDRRITLFGDETHWWVFNDKGNVHTESGGGNIGMEIHAQAFSFATDDEINKMTFFNYELINRSSYTLKETYFAQYVDPDLGNPNDDYVGCDVSRGLGYVYNGDAIDESQSSHIGYGEHPPALGVDFFEGPYQDSDGEDNPLITSGLNPAAEALQQGGIVYPGLGIGYGDSIVDNERLGMRVFMYYTNQAPATQSDPESMGQYYNYMQGVWGLGDSAYYGGTGYNPSGGIRTSYMFPDDSDELNWATGGVDVPNDSWSEYEPNGSGSSGNPAGDRRFVQSAGPFTLRPGAVNNITVGIVFARSNEGGIFASVDALKRADTKAQALFDNCFRIIDPPNAPVLTIQELNNELILMLDNPDIFSNNFGENYIQEDDLNIDPSFTDRYYRFEGYQIYQMRDEEATVADIDEPGMAELVAQCDVKNGVKRLINFEFDEELGFSVPVEKADGTDEGIKHTFRITQDAFASGDRRLVNHKTYYYIAVAYAYNNFKDYDPNDPTQLDGQKKPYLRSRLNADGTAILAHAAIPHHPMPEAGGTYQAAAYGQTPRITRLDGLGNGNNALKLTDASRAKILQTGFLKDPEYDNNGGPINIKVVDPLNVADGYFECEFNEFTDIDTASWVIKRYNHKGGDLLESVSSDVTIALDNEQIIPQWGVSVQIYQKKHYYFSPGPVYNSYTEPISSEYTFADSSKRWLSFVQDDAQIFPTNWIRTGTYSPDQATECDPLPDDYLNPCCYRDEVGKDPKELYSKLLGGGIAPHRVTGYQCDFMPLAYPANFASFSGARARASIAFLPSVEIVITSDKTKWTRCPVIELGRDANLNVGGGKPGELRKSPSVDKNGRKLGDAGYNPSEVTQPQGMGWFPGYVIDLESGARLHMAFGENSFLGAQNGADMIWNPTDEVVDANGIPVMGGQHPVYIYGHRVGYGASSTPCPYYDGSNDWVYDQYMAATTTAYGDLFESLTWILNPVLTEGHSLRECDVTIRACVNKEYKEFNATGINGGKPMYSWNMDTIRTVVASQDHLASALDLINVVPNPYYAYSAYERSRLDNRVKITNLPENCTVTIYNVGGKLIRTYKKDSPVTSIDWDLKNSKGIPISSGVYIIHVEVPGAGEKILKFFGGMRQIDLENI